MRTTPRKRAVLALSSVLLAVAIAFGWHNYREPLSGGAQPDGFFARWAKNRAYATIPPDEDRAATRLTPENANGWYGINAEPVQSLALYQSQNPLRPTPARRTLVLQPLGAIDAEEKALLQDCKNYCEAFFGLPTRVAPPLALDMSQLSTRRASVGSSQVQLDAGQLLGRVLAPHLPADAVAYLGITRDDLWTQGLSFVFGQATLRERVGVYSIARYFPKHRAPKLTAQQRQQQRQLVLRRTVQVLTHEAGHMFGITHCVLYKCTMNGSNSLADSDASPLAFCPVCTRKLAWNIGFDASKRAANLEALRRRFGLKN